MDATVVALATRWSSCGWRPWVRRSLKANMAEEQVFKTCETWAVMVSLALSRTPRTLSVVTLSSPSMNGCEGRCMDLDLARVTRHFLPRFPFINNCQTFRDSPNKIGPMSKDLPPPLKLTTFYTLVCNATQSYRPC